MAGWVTQREAADRACLDHPAFDLGSWLSQEVVHHQTTGGEATDDLNVRFEGLLDGYAAVVRCPGRHAIIACTLAALLRRAVDPVRQCHPGWTEGVARRVELVEQLTVADGRSPR